MPKMYTNKALKPVQPTTTDKAKFCVSSYEEYEAQRVEINTSFPEIQVLTESYRSSISSPLRTLNPNLEMGEYFVIPVKEIQDVLNSCEGVKFIHVCNAVRDVINTAGEAKKFPVTILVPIVKKTNGVQEEYKVCDDPDSKYIEAYPCPPDPKCPKINEMVGTILKSTHNINTYKSLT